MHVQKGKRRAREGGIAVPGKAAGYRLTTVGFDWGEWRQSNAVCAAAVLKAAAANY